MQFTDRSSATKGSFGIPEELKEAQERQRTKTESAKEQSPVTEEVQLKQEDLSKEAKEQTPTAILKKMGADFNDEDFQALIFKGIYEAEIDVVPNRLRAKFKTLIGDEYDEIDEIIANEIKDIPMTNDGLKTRTAMWVISYGVTSLAGKPLSKLIKGKDDKPDTRAMAAERRKVFAAMAPAIVNQLIQKHGAITMAINLIITANPADNLKNS